MHTCRATGEPEPRLRSLANDLWLEFPFATDYLDAVGAAETRTTPEVTGEVRPLISVLKDQTLGRAEMRSLLTLKGQANFRDRYLLPALAAGVLEMTIPDKPNSRLQKYRLAVAGKRLASQLRAP